ncbi:Uma2 family endonuclease [Spirulina sp. CS-785/01]|uniref:Uma2 family endonuclease n=1 Tax=Spirulina sp. CS-785/01 TaxID=3021716 RepID=UPI00232C8CCA|nr:Uma2 family endonuclease [Spirulina sp. CS-785/01]MDB9314776.1 Uma2 family endonuclease [Spirulina sp. CS-785/01]
MQVQLQQIVVSPGQQLLMTDVSWSMYEQLLEELGEKRGSRMNYSQGVLEIMVPLPEHEDYKVMIADFVKVLLEELGVEFRSLGSTTFKSEQMQQGIEADDCFYIENESVIRGKRRIDLTLDPPPDLVLEIDITSRTHLDNYVILGVGELWRFNGAILEINVLQGGEYIPVETSPHFPDFPLCEVIPQYLEQSRVDGRNAAIQAFRSWVRGVIVES